jgi:hypothetical protein
MNTARSNYTATLLGNGGVLVTGGYNGSLGVGSSCELYLHQVEPSITTQPTSQTITAGQTVSFIAAATGTPTPTVQWQVSTDGGTSFSNLAGATSPTLSFTVALAQSGNEYRAVFTNVAGSATTNAATLTVAPAAASHFVVSGFPAQVTAGDTNHTITVTAYDDYGDVATGYTGTFHFSSSDGQAALPADTPLTNGTGTFSVTLFTAGSQSLTATDTVTGSITGTQAGITVTPAAADHLVFLQPPTDAAAGQTINPAVVVAVVDQYGNVVTGDNTDTVTLSIGVDPSGGAATLSGTLTVTVVNGVATFTDLSIDMAGAGYTLHATVGGTLADIDSDPFNVTM